MKKKSEAGYNERLFSDDFRGKLHAARYHWLANRLEHMQCPYETVLELGCFDGKVIDYLPKKPQRYLGLDANWEGGLDIAGDRWRGESSYVFRYCSTPEEMEVAENEYDISICMETLEHVPPELVDPYLEKLATTTRNYAYITVPNEIGIVFFFKHLAKWAMGGDVRGFTLAEFVNATLGRTERVRRDNHKGFNYNDVIVAVRRHFDIREVSGHPLGIAPPLLNFGVGIIATPKH